MSSSPAPPAQLTFLRVDPAFVNCRPWEPLQVTAVARPADQGGRPWLPPVRLLGPLSVAALAVAFAVLWVLVGPPGGGWLSFAGQLAGAEAVLLMSVAFYVYRETVARHLAALHDYQVAAVNPVGAGLTEIALTPLGRPITFTPGQFAMLFLETGAGWRRHPFTISSAPHQQLLRFTIKALGDDTTRMQTLVQPGMPAVVGGPHGRFDRARGTDRQIWIAGGIGITPFLSWLRALDQHTAPAQVDLFYSSQGEAPFAEEIRGIARAHPGITVHLHDTSQRGYLTAETILDLVGGDRRRLSVFLCGPAAMVNAFVRRFRQAGVPTRNIHREHFDWR